MRHSNKTVQGVRRATLAALGITLMGLASAYATTVTTWHYDISSSFDTSQTQFTDNNDSSIVNTPTKLAWGDPAGNTPQSSLVIDPSTQTGRSVDTWIGGGVVPAGYISDPNITLTHNNWPIYAPSLLSAALSNTITLTPWVPPGQQQSPITLSFGINFAETTNAYPCAIPPANAGNPCPDIFVIDQGSLNQSFSYDGQQYFLSMFPADDGRIIVLSDAACDAAGVGHDCLGFWTEESASTPLYFGLSITTSRFVIPHADVPEPGTLGIMGLGLLGIAGLAIRRRRLGVTHD